VEAAGEAVVHEGVLEHLLERRHDVHLRGHGRDHLRNSSNFVSHGL
jgi:hypothetical protein